MSDSKKFCLMSRLDRDQANVMLSILVNLFGFDGPEGAKVITVNKEQFESIPAVSELSMIADIETGNITIILEPSHE